MLEDDIISSKDYLKIIYEVRFCKNMNFNDVLFYLIITVIAINLVCSLRFNVSVVYWLRTA